MPKKTLPHLPWCYSDSDDHFSGFDMPSRLAAIEEALDECEGDTIYLAQHTPSHVELPIETDIEELLCTFSERHDLGEWWDIDKKNVTILKERLKPLYEEANAIFRRWLTAESLMPLDFHNEEELSREQAQIELRDALSVHEARALALKQISQDIQWVESFLTNQNLKSEAEEAIERIKNTAAPKEEGGTQ